MLKSREERKKYQKEYRDKHKEERKEYDVLRYIENKKYFQDKNLNYSTKNKKKISKRQRQLRIENKANGNDAKTKKKSALYMENKRREDVGFNLRDQISKNIATALKKTGSSKNGISILKYLPYTIKQLKRYLEKQFEYWMDWENWGRLYINWDDNDPVTWTWNIDHIIPQSHLIYTSMEDENFKKCWALENLRPYSAKQNLIDGNRR